jgi:hypothetical protein
MVGISSSWRPPVFAVRMRCWVVFLQMVSIKRIQMLLIRIIAKITMIVAMSIPSYIDPERILPITHTPSVRIYIRPLHHTIVSQMTMMILLRRRIRGLPRQHQHCCYCRVYYHHYHHHHHHHHRLSLWYPIYVYQHRNNNNNNPRIGRRYRPGW